MDEPLAVGNYRAPRMKPGGLPTEQRELSAAVGHVTRLVEHAAPERGDLVAADDHRIRALCRNRLGFYTRQAQCPVSRHLARQMILAGGRPDDLEWHAQPFEQGPPVG